MNDHKYADTFKNGLSAQTRTIVNQNNKVRAQHSIQVRKSVNQPDQIPETLNNLLELNRINTCEDEYGKDTIEDVVINKHSDHLCVGENHEIKSPTVRKTGDPVEQKTTAKKLMISSRTEKVNKGINSCKDEYGKNTLEDIVVNQKSNELCAKNIEELAVYDLSGFPVNSQNKRQVANNGHSGQQNSGPELGQNSGKRKRRRRNAIIEAIMEKIV